MTGRDGLELRRAVRSLTIRFTALILVVLVLVGALVYAIVAASAAGAERRTLAAAAGVDSPGDGSPGEYITILDDGGVETSRELPDELPDAAALGQVQADGGEVYGSVDIDGQDYGVLTMTGDRGRVIQVALSRHEQEEELGRLLVALVISGVVALAAAATVGTLMARRAMRPLADALALQRRFVADASHELRTPLTLLSTRAQLLRRRLPRGEGADAAVEEGVDEIVQDARVLTELLEDLLMAADPRETSPVSAVDVVAVGDRAISSLATAAGERSVILERTGTATSAVVDGTATGIGRLFTALIANALDHARSRVAVSVDVRGREAVVTVSDDGTGFPVDLGDTAFERFASARPPAGAAGSRHYGLGLALVADIVARHRGTVAIDPTADGGAVVVRLPLSTSRRTAAAEDSAVG